MTEVGIRGVDLLQDRMQKTQESLKDVDENIKKLTGRSPADFRGGRRGRGGPMGRGGRDGPPSRLGSDRTPDGQARLFSIARRSLGGLGGSRGVVGMERDRNTRRSLGAPRYSRDSDDEDLHHFGLSSSVKQSVIEVPSREESLSKQKQDKKGLARNKRMFGLLLGTLQKFKNDSTHVDQNKKRQEIEEKLEQKAREEKAEINRQKQDLWDARRKKTRELRRLETKLELVENHQKWETETLKMKNFIRTETKPCIFWLPKDHVPETLRKHASSKKVLDKLIEERKKEMEKDIEAILDEAENEEKMNVAHHDDDEEENDGDEDDQKDNGDAPPVKRMKKKSEGSDLDEAMEAADHAIVTDEVDVAGTKENVIEDMNEEQSESKDLPESEHQTPSELENLQGQSDIGVREQSDQPSETVESNDSPEDNPESCEPMDDDSHDQ